MLCVYFLEPNCDGASPVSRGGGSLRGGGEDDALSNDPCSSEQLRLTIHQDDPKVALRQIRVLACGGLSSGRGMKVLRVDEVSPKHPSSDVALQATSGLSGVCPDDFQSPVECIGG